MAGRHTAANAATWFRAFKPAPIVGLAEWAEQHGRLPDGSRFHPFAYQRGILDAISDSDIEFVTVKKGARVGYTACLNAAIGYAIAAAPKRVMVLQPTVEDAEDYSKDEIDPLLEWPCIQGLVTDGSRKASNTIRKKFFPGGSLRLAGANSPRAFRRVTLDWILFDEVDGYEQTAGAEGDQIALGTKRTLTSPERKVVVGSTPTRAGLSRIEKRFEDSDQRYYEVPCPHCGTYQALVWGDGTGTGIRWPKGEPHKAHYVCINGCVIEEADKPDMIARGEWRARKPFAGHAGFHIWAAYSLFPNAAWSKLAAEFEEVKKDPERLIVFVNQVLGEVWQDKGDAPEWERLYERREDYPLGRAPRGALMLTAGVDVQKDRIEVSVWAWGREKRSWLVEHRVLMGDTSRNEVWAELSAMVAETWPHDGGAFMALRRVAIDTGYATQEVYAWCRSRPAVPVIAVKGVDSRDVPVGSPTSVDVTALGKRIRRGIKVWPVSGPILKRQLYGWLKQAKAIDGEPDPPGFVHLPKVDDEFVKQLTAEQPVDRIVKGYKRTEWQKTRERNEALDCRVYATAAAINAGLDRFTERDWRNLEASLGMATEPEPPAPAAPAPQVPPPAVQQQQTRRSNWLGTRRGWLR